MSSSKEVKDVTARDNSSKAEMLWHPSQRQGKNAMNEYRFHVNQQFGKDLQTTAELQEWSVKQPHVFWPDLHDFLNIVPSLPPKINKAYDDTVPMSQIPPFFPGHRLNYAENVLYSNPDSTATAFISIRDSDEGPRETVSWGEFRERVRKTASALKRSGIEQGDRVAALVSTSVWAIVLFHAAASIGAIFTSITPDFGLQGCISRLQQVRPNILFMDSHTFHKGSATPTAHKLRKIVEVLQARPQVVVLPLEDAHICEFQLMPDFLKRAKESDDLLFTRVPFNHPLVICYSSGTTGKPKCIVHHHGMVLQLKKISVIHNCLTPKDTILQYSSTSWIVFYGMCGHLTSGATLILYDGSPLFPDAKRLLRLSQYFKVTFLAVSPRLLLEIEMSGTVPKKEFNLNSLKTLQSAGAPLLLDQYKWVYRAFPSHVQLSNMAGGTESGTPFIVLDPSGPVYAGEMQVIALGSDVDALDPETGDSVIESGEPGELVIKQPFASMPCQFWNDKGGKLYRAAYFERFSDKDVWAQHDWVRRNPITGGYIIVGRSDGILNPSGIRFGSGEIYSVLERAPFLELFTNTLCVGRKRPTDFDEQVFLFVVPKSGVTLTSKLQYLIRAAIQEELSPRHVPKYILEAPEIPLTITGKRVETLVKKVLSGHNVKASESIQNPKSLEWFRRFQGLEEKKQVSKL